MRYLFVISLAMVFLSSCMPLLKGDSFKAEINRDKMSSLLLEDVSPDGCGYASFGEQYGYCKDPKMVELINKRVESVKKEIIEYLYNNPDFSNSYIFWEIVFNDLYYCRDEKGNGLVIGENTIYCETKLPSVVEKRFTDNGLKYLSKKNGKYSYFIRWDHKKRWQDYMVAPFLIQNE